MTKRQVTMMHQLRLFVVRTFCLTALVGAISGAVKRVLLLDCLVIQHTISERSHWHGNQVMLENLVIQLAL